MSRHFPGFSTLQVDISGASIHLVTGGNGPPLLLLHGYPETHLIWRKVAPGLARSFTLVLPDLRGYGDSSKPEPGPDGANYAKRALALDQVETMSRLGFDRFSVAGHDHGARVTHRLLLDHGDRIDRAALLDIDPTLHRLETMDLQRALASFHWLLMAQPGGLPERLIGAAPEFYLRHLLGRAGGNPSVVEPHVFAEYQRCFVAPGTIPATCAEYRASVTADLVHDRADRGRKVTTPLLVLWAAQRHHAEHDPLDAWRQFAEDVRGQGIDCGHYIPEEAPDVCGRLLDEILRGDRLVLVGVELLVRWMLS